MHSQAGATLARRLGAPGHSFPRLFLHLIVLSARAVGLPSARAASSAEPEEDHLVALEREAGGEAPLEPERAPRDLEDAVAAAASEVVVVALARDLVAGRLAGKLDGLDPALREERLDRAVDGRLRHARGGRLGVGEELLRAQRAI